MAATPTEVNLDKAQRMAIIQMAESAQYWLNQAMSNAHYSYNAKAPAIREAQVRLERIIEALDQKAGA